jgi:DNA invertase Pin-like site-specific DNA recombinase
MEVGYARVTTLHQALALRLEALKASGGNKIFRDKLDGANVSRPLALRIPIE